MASEKKRTRIIAILIVLNLSLVAALGGMLYLIYQPGSSAGIN